MVGYRITLVEAVTGHVWRGTVWGVGLPACLREAEAVSGITSPHTRVAVDLRALRVANPSTPA